MVLDAATEHDVLTDAKGEMEKEFGCPLVIEIAEKSKEQKAGQAFPGKPAILLQ